MAELPDLATLAPGAELAALLEEVELPAVPGDGLPGLLGGATRQISRLQALRYAAMAELSRREPPPGPDVQARWRRREPGEWAIPQIAAELRLTRRRAEQELSTAMQLVEHLPLVWAALFAGQIDGTKAWLFCQYLPGLPPAQIDLICRRVLPLAGDWTSGQLGYRLLREVQAIDPTYSRRRYEKAVQERSVCGYLSEDGTAVLSGRGLTPSEAAGAAERLEKLAAAIRAAGHPATETQLRADLFVGLLDGRWERLSGDQIIAAMLVEAAGPETGAAGPPPQDSPDDSEPVDSEPVGIEVRVGLPTLLGLNDHPGELPGWGPVPAADARRSVARQHAAEWRFAVLDPDGYLILGGLLRRRPTSKAAGRSVRGGVVEIHIRADRLVQLAAQTDLPDGWAPVIGEIMRHYGNRDDELAALDEQPDARFPSGSLRRHVQMRDRTCVFPGCRRPARKCHIDHTCDHAKGGKTTCANTEPLCRLHHTVKHRDGWTLTQPEPGRFRWRSPLGRIYETRGEPIAPDLPDPINPYARAKLRPP